MCCWVKRPVFSLLDRWCYQLLVRYGLRYWRGGCQSVFTILRDAYSAVGDRPALFAR